MDKTFFVWYPVLQFQNEVCIYAPLLLLMYLSLTEFFEHKRFTGEKIREWAPSSPNLNPIKKLYSIVKMKLYEGDKQ